MNIEHTRIYIGGITNNQANPFNSLNLQQNPIRLFSNNQNSEDKVLAKRQEAREKAMGLVKDVFEAEKSIDDDLKERAARVDEAQQNILSAQAGLKEIEERKKELMESCDSEEYEQLAMEVDASGEIYRDSIKESQKVILEENAIIRAIGLERLKSHPMTEAADQAEEIMESANKEIIGMLVDESKEIIDARLEETKEEMEAVKEEEKEQEEYIEEIQQQNEELEASIEKRREENKSSEIVLPEVPMEQLLELDAIKTEVKQEVKNILSEMKMLAEDIKGTVVDTDI